MADDALLDQALGNLLENAATHTPAGTRVDLGARATDAEIVIEVADRGPGVPAANARHAPDVSLTAAAGRGAYLIVSGGALRPVGGTSAGSPAFAGIVALLNQYLVKQGALGAPGLGNINPMLYRLEKRGWIQGRWVEKAGQQALERDNNQEAVRFYGEMLAFDTAELPDVTAVRRAAWHTRLGEAHFYLAHLPEAVEQLERALAMLGVGLPASKGGEVWFTARHVAAQLAHLARGSRPRAEAVESARIAAAAASLLAWIQMVRHDGARLAQMSLLSVNLAERAGTTSVLFVSTHS